MTFYTGDVVDAGTDSQVFIKVFGVRGSSSDIYMDKMSERFERGKVDLIKVTGRNLYVDRELWIVLLQNKQWIESTQRGQTSR